MPLPKYLDAPPPKAARDELIIAQRTEPRFVRAFTRLSRALLDDGTRKEMIRRLEDPAFTINDVVNTMPWFNLADPESVALWNLYSDALERAYIDVVEQAGTAALKEVGIGDRFRFEVAKAVTPISFPSTIDWIRDRVLGQIVDVTDQQRSMIARLIEGQIAAGERADDVMEEITRVVGLTDREAGAVGRRFDTILDTTGSEAAAKKGADRYSGQLLKVRGRRIARTEVKEAMSQGQLDSWQSAKEQGAFPPGILKRWVDIGDERTSDICGELGNHEPIPINEAFDSSFVGPVMRPPAHPNCRSVLVLVFPDDI